MQRLQLSNLNQHVPRVESHQAHQAKQPQQQLSDRRKQSQSQRSFE